MNFLRNMSADMQAAVQKRSIKFRVYGQVQGKNLGRNSQFKAYSSVQTRTKRLWV